MENLHIKNNYTVFHLHSHTSNCIMMDSSTDYISYIKKAKELDMPSIAFSEHGNIFNWIHKKLKCDESNIKYIHGQEFYLTLDLINKVRDNFHIGLYAKNYEGVKELNKLSSISFNKVDGHFYYRPRITLEELKNTSSNIIITTACLASILWQKKDEDVVKDFLQWMSENKNRCFLEIQYHSCQEQKEYNQLLYKWSKEYSLKLIAGTDTHALDQEDLKLRKILQKSKKIDFKQDDQEAEFDLSFQTYDELVNKFKVQNALPEDVYLEAINNTNYFDSLIESFELDKTHKYPKISVDAKKDLQKRINDGIINRKINLWDKEKRKTYYSRIKEEFEIFEQLNMLDYIILLDNIINFCKQNNIAYSPRGSCNGSQVLWAMGITDMDSLKYKLPFFRFCNPSRISLGDVDIDMAGFKRDLVKDFLYSYPGISGCSIITYQRYALRGAIKAIGRGLEIPLTEIELISQDIDEIIEEDDSGEEIKRTTFRNKEKWEKEYPELLYWASKCIGLIENSSVHACGFVVTDKNIDEEIGVFETDKCQWKISQNDMKAIDAINFVKMDLLVVDNVQIIDDTCRLANIPILNNGELDFEDMNVWNEMLKSGLGIFQFEKTGWQHLKHTLENFDKFKESSNKINKLDVMSALNGIIRPSGDSIRDNFIKGISYKSGMPEIDEFLGDSLGYLIYQEQIMMWLYNFCEYTMAQSDMVRRGIAKKGGTEKLIPEIEKGFLNYCLKTYPQYTEIQLKEVLQKFIQIILDASDYGFSINHSMPYSILGFKGAYLRHYYPLEFLTVLFNMNEGKMDKITKIQEFMNKHTNIKSSPIKFRFSQSSYSFDKNKNIIYKGIKSIKFLNEKIAEELFNLKDKQYESFIDLLIDITENTSCNTRQLIILIKLNFFSEFGLNKKLLETFEKFDDRYKKTYVEKTKIKRLEEIREFEKTIENKIISVQEQIITEKEYLGYGESTFKTEHSYGLVLNIDTKYTPKILIYHLDNGEEKEYKIYKKNLYSKPTCDDPDSRLLFNKYDVIQLGKTFEKARSKLVDGKWEETSDIDIYINGFAIVKKYISPTIDKPEKT